jgi:hypothetical protein
MATLPSPPASMLPPWPTLARPQRDTLVLTPAAALTRKSAWQPLFNGVPLGGVVIVTADGWPAERLDKIIAAFAAHGRLATLIPLDSLIERQARLF